MSIPFDPSIHVYIHLTAIQGSTMGYKLCKGPGVATVTKNPEMLPFRHKAYSLVGAR